MSDKLNMKRYFVIFLIAISNFALGQPTTGCCPLNKSADEIIPKGTVSTSCLLCKSSPIVEFKFFKNKDERGGKQTDRTKISEAKRSILKRCQKTQANVINQSISAIASYNAIQDIKVNSIEELLVSLELHLGLNFLGKVENVLSSKQIEARCSKDEEIRSKLSKKLSPSKIKYQNIIKQLVEIKESHKLMSNVFCRYYEISKTEKDFLKRIKQIDELNKSSIKE